MAGEKLIRFSSRRCVSGFTLIEVIVAIVIVAIALLSAMQLSSRQANNVVEVEKRILASWVASNHLAQLQFDAKTSKVRARTHTKRYKMGGQEWRSRAKVKATEVERVFLVELTVSDDNGRDKAVYATLTSALSDAQ